MRRPLSEPSVQWSGYCLLGARRDPNFQGLSWRASGAYLFQGSWLQYRGRRHRKIQSFWSASWFRLVAELRTRQLLGSAAAHKFVVRGGFGMYWNRDAEEGQLQNLSDPPGFKSSFGAGDFGGSPSFANPFMDISTGQTETNPFPYARPSPGTAVELAQLCGVVYQHLSKELHGPVCLQLQSEPAAGVAGKHGPPARLCRLVGP